MNRNAPPGGDASDRAGKDLSIQASTGDIISFLRLAVQRKEDFLKLNLRLPGGAELSFEREPMEPYKFYTVCWAIVLCIVAVSFFGIFK